MIKQLELMEAEMDRFIDYDTELSGKPKPNELIYTEAKEIKTIIDSVQKDLDEISIRLMPENKKNENISSITYEDKKTGEVINVDVIYIKLE